jgi:hypothetical protein
MLLVMSTSVTHTLLLGMSTNVTCTLLLGMSTRVNHILSLEIQRSVITMEISRKLTKKREGTKKETKNSPT